MRILYLILVSLFSILFLFSLCMMTLGKIFSQPGYTGEKSDHFNGTIFKNTGQVPSKGLFDVLKWYMTREQGEWTEVSESEVSFAEPQSSPPDSGMVVTYVNHSTFLIQTAGMNILTDPVWSDRVSPLSFAGPKRFRPPGIRFEDLPNIDLIIISHNHYDHLDIETLRRLNDRFEPLVITPLGVSEYLNQEGINQTAELDWWEENTLSDSFKVHSVPAQHFSGRGLYDRDKTLWSGYLIEAGGRKIYFAGDTGYGDFFNEIGSRFAPIDLGLIPIGAYQPRWFMKPMHIDPSEAIQAHKDIGAVKSFGMHFNTFPMADDGMQDPLNDLQKALENSNPGPVDFSVAQEGRSIRLF
ncbi:MBL fold metallo-hydrolase [Balneola sp. MJW-20]|uniref:MBL fold metallo-hydrolase n=1 Tax=Gracilimonas aurantiaca TaxID=3234185 RepID=UPI0034669C46